jgi:DNA-binding transcriptional regulator GbsR (MarR family)
MAKKKTKQPVKAKDSKGASSVTGSSYSFFDALIQGVKSEQIAPTVAILEAIERLVHRVEEIQGGMEAEARQIRDELSALKDALDER